MPLKIWINGKLVPKAKAALKAFTTHGLLYGDGVFEGIRVYNGRVFKLDTHLRRLEESARAIRLTIPRHSRAPQLTAAVHKTLAANEAAGRIPSACA